MNKRQKKKLNNKCSVKCYKNITFTKMLRSYCEEELKNSYYKFFKNCMLFGEGYMKIEQDEKLGLKYEFGFGGVD